MININKIIKKILLGIVIALFLLVLCVFVNRSIGISIDNIKHQKITYKELPVDVQNIYAQSAKEKENKLTCICLDCHDSVLMQQYTLDKSMFALLANGFIYRFTINKKHYKLKANTGEPFVIKENKFYYPTEFNVDDKNFYSIKYYVVKLLP